MSVFEDLREWATRSSEDVPVSAMADALVKAGMAEPNMGALSSGQGGSLQPTDAKPRGMYHDPYAALDWGGWRQRPSALTYDAMATMASEISPVASIIRLRTSQVAAFCRPQQGKYDKGYRVILRDRRDQKKGMSPAEQKEAEDIERFLETTAVLLPDEKPADRDSFSSFVKKIVRDALVYDQACHPAGTRVHMADGSVKPIEEVQIGDLVWTHLGRVRRVTDVKRRLYTGKLVTLRSRAQEVTATEGHPLFVEADKNSKLRFYQDRGLRPDWLEAGAVREGMYLTYPKLVVGGDEPTKFGPYEVTEDFARFLGQYAAQGHTQKGAVTLTYHEDAEEQRLHVEKIAEALGLETRRVPYEDRAAEGIRINKGESRIGYLLDEEVGRGAAHKRVPDCVLRGTRGVRAAFLRGYLEGDGAFTPNGMTFNTSSESLFFGVRALLAAEGCYVSESIGQNSAVNPNWRDVFRGRVSGIQWRAFCEFAGLPLPTAPATREACLQDNNRFYLRVKRVTCRDVEDFPVFNLEVEEDHSYLAEGFASHNCWEKIRDRAGRPSRFVALPSETIRPAVTDVEYLDPQEMRSRVSHVQVYENTVIAEFTQDDIAWNVMNPRSGIRVNGFGFSPLEEMIRLGSGWLFGMSHNIAFYRNGAATKGLLNIKGAIPDRQLRAFRRMWYSMVAGVGNAWRTPILNSEDVQWLDMHAGNRDMEFGQWMDWLTKIICALYLLDPTEINFIFGNSGQTSSLSAARPNEEEVTESKDKGLRPLLDHVSESLNRHLLWDINPDFEFAFVGIDAHDEERDREADEKDVKTIFTVNEVRARRGEEPLPAKLGDVILDSNWMQWAQAQQMQQQQSEQQALGGDGTGEDNTVESLFGKDQPGKPGMDAGGPPGLPGAEGAEGDDEDGGDGGDGPPGAGAAGPPGRDDDAQDGPPKKGSPGKLFGKSARWQDEIDRWLPR